MEENNENIQLTDKEIRKLMPWWAKAIPWNLAMEELKSGSGDMLNFIAKQKFSHFEIGPGEEKAVLIKRSVVDKKTVEAHLISLDKDGDIADILESYDVESEIRDFDIRQLFIKPDARKRK